MHSQHRMNYELRAIRFNHSGSIFGAEHMGKICTLRGKKKQKTYTHEDRATYRLTFKTPRNCFAYTSLYVLFSVQKWQQSKALQCT